MARRTSAGTADRQKKNPDRRFHQLGFERLAAITEATRRVRLESVASVVVGYSLGGS